MSCEEREMRVGAKAIAQRQRCSIALTPRAPSFFTTRFAPRRARGDLLYFYHFDTESEFTNAQEARDFAKTIVEYNDVGAAICPICALINPATNRVMGHRGQHLKKKAVVDPFEKRKKYPLLDRIKNPTTNHEFPEEHWEVKKLEKSGHSYFRHLSTGREFTSTSEARGFAMTQSYYTPPPVIPFDPFVKRRTFPFMDRAKNVKVNLEFPADAWEVRCTSRSSQFYIKHLASGREFLSILDARALAKTLPNYVAPNVAQFDPYDKRRTYPLLDRAR